MAGIRSHVLEGAASLAYIVVWMAFSIALILSNKWLLAFRGFPFPIALTMFHMAFCSTLAALFIKVFHVVSTSDEMTRTVYLQSVVPIAILYAGSLWFSNSAYIHLSVSFIQMLKALMPVTVYALGVFGNLEEIDTIKLLNMVVISLGVGIAAFGELRFSWTGLALQLSGQGAEAGRLVLIQILLQAKGLKLNPITTIYYIAPSSLLALVPPFLLVELFPIIDFARSKGANFNISYILANGAVAFGLNIAVFLLIGKTSALTLNIAGVLKDWLLIGFSNILFEAPVTALNLEGFTLALIGVGFYNYLKMQNKSPIITKEES